MSDEATLAIVRTIVIEALVQQLRVARNERKREKLRWKILDAMKPLDHLDIPDVGYVQIVQRPSVLCGKCDNALVYKPEVEVIYAA